MSKYVILITRDTCFLWLLADLSTNLQCLLSEHVTVCVRCSWSQASSCSNYSQPPSDTNPNVSGYKPHAPCGWGQTVLVSDATEKHGRGGGMKRECHFRLGTCWHTVGSGGKPGHMAEGRAVGLILQMGSRWATVNNNRGRVGYGECEKEWRGGVGRRWGEVWG